ncbi:MAG: hypothetical protein ABEN55_10555 [Bradymonadaceae bacterium]
MDRRCSTPTSTSEIAADRRRDPISVIDLEAGNERFVRNLPGFGPVQIAPRGQRAVGFVDGSAVDESLFDDKSQVPPEPETDNADKPKYYLMVIDTESLDFELHAYGDILPRYEMTPDGRALLVDRAVAAEENEKLQHFDTETGTLRDFQGPTVELNNYVMTGDATGAYAIDEELFELDIPNKTVAEMEVGFTPMNLNLGPEGENLYLRKPDDTICIYSLSSETCTGEFFRKGGDAES